MTVEQTEYEKAVAYLGGPIKTENFGASKDTEPELDATVHVYRDQVAEARKAALERARKGPMRHWTGHDRLPTVADEVCEVASAGPRNQG